MSDEDFKHSYPIRTVCEVTRELMDIIDSLKGVIDDDRFGQIVSRLREQMHMQKKMDARLRLNLSMGIDDMCRDNPNHKVIEAERQRRYA